MHKKKAPGIIPEAFLTKLPVVKKSANRQRQAWNIEILIHTGDLAKIFADSVSTRINLASASRRVIAPVSVGHGRAKYFSAKERTGWKLKNLSIALGGIR